MPASIINTDITTLSASAFAALTISEIKSLSSTQCAAIVASQLGNLPAEKIAALPLNFLSSATLTGISTSAVNGLAIKNLSNEQIQALTVEQISAFTADSEQVGALTASQLSVLNSSHFSSLSNEALEGLNSTYIAGLNTTQINTLASVLKPNQLNAFSHLANLDSQTVAAISPETLKAINVSALNVSYLTPQQISQLTPETLANFTVAQISNFTPEQSAFLKPAQIAVLSAAQTSAFPITAIASLKPQVIKSLNLNAFDSAGIGALTTKQVAYLTAANILQISTANVSGLTVEQINAMKVTSLQGLSTAVRNTLGANIYDAYQVKANPSQPSTIVNLNAAETYTEDTPLNFVNDIVVSSTSSPNITVTLTLSNMDAGSFNTASSNNVTTTFSAGIWTASGAIADVNTLLAGLIFTPASNFNSSFTVTANVSDALSPAITGVKNFTGIAVNDAPIATNSTVTTNEDTPKIFAASDFNFTDIENNALSAIIITSLPAMGTLKLNNVTVTANQEISVVDISNLTFTPATNANGINYASFDFKVKDDGGTANGGVDTSNIVTAAVNVTRVDDLATGSLQVNGALFIGNTLSADLNATDPDGEIIYSYQWQQVFYDGIAYFYDISGATSQSFTADSSGYYAVKVTTTDSLGGTTVFNSDVVTVVNSQSSGGTSNDDYSSDSLTEGIISLINGVGSISGNIESAYDVDWFKVNLIAGETYQINQDGSGNPILNDTYFDGIYDAQSNFLGYDNDDYNDLYSQVTFTPSATGDYYLSAKGFANSTGNYTLSVKKLFTPPTTAQINGNHTYILSAGNASWQQTQAQAVSLGGNLVTINDAIENAWLVSTFGGTEEYWMGLTDEVTENTFVWINNEDASYRNWATSPIQQPDNSNNQDYGVINWGGNPGGWDDQGVNDLHRGIIEIPYLNVAPTATNITIAETYTEDTQLNLTDIVITDTDSVNITVTLALSNVAAGNFNVATSNSVTSTYDSQTGIWWTSGAIADVNALLAGVNFTPTVNFNSNFTVAVNISDGIAPAITGSKNFTGTAVNDVPTIAALPPSNALQNPATGNYYSLSTSTTWQNAENQAIELGGHLVTINDAQEKDWLVQTYGNNELFWIGFTDQQVENTFAWSSGEPVTYTNWNTDLYGNIEPNNSGNEDYTVINWDNRTNNIGKWNDLSGVQPYRGIIEISGTRKITLLEDTTRNFQLNNFGSDVDGNLVSVTITSLPEKGLLKLNGETVTTGQVIPVNSISTLTFTPAANENSANYTTIPYILTDSADETINGSLAIDVIAVNDAPTGSVTILGTPQVGQALTASNDLADADGLGTISYQWKADNTIIDSALSSTYVLVAGDVNKTIAVTASYTDGGGTVEAVTSEATIQIVGSA